MFGKSAPKQSSRRRKNRGSTLIEMAMGVSVMSVVFAGVMGAFVQSRKMTEGSIFQNSAVTVILGYLEQIKNMDFVEIPYYSGNTLMRGTIATNDDVLYTQLDSDTMDILRISTGTPITAGSVTPGTVPAGVVDNYKVVDINDTPDTSADDLMMHIWIWIAPLDNPGSGVAAARSINVVYTWAFNNGNIQETNVESIATIRSAVPTF